MKVISSVWNVLDRRRERKGAIYRTTPLILPTLFCTRLELDLDVSHYVFLKDIKGFMNYAICLSKAF